MGMVTLILLDSCDTSSFVEKEDGLGHFASESGDDE